MVQLTIIDAKQEDAARHRHPRGARRPRPDRRDRRHRHELRRRARPDARRRPAPEPAQQANGSACCRTLASRRRAATKPTSRSTPKGLADWLERFVTEYGVNIIGGCCGTTHEHLAAVVKRVGGKKPAKRSPVYLPAVVQFADAQELVVDQRPLLVGERTNTNGSRKFKQLLEKEDWHGLVEMAQEQEREGVHVLDVCVDYVGRDGVRDMKVSHQAVQRRLDQAADARQHRGAGDRGGIEALQRQDDHQFSINLEDGRKTLDPKTKLAKKYGAALVALTIDEKGQADTAEWKFEVAKRIYDIVVDEYKHSAERI